MSRDEVLGLSLRRPADINVILIGSETDGTEGQGVGLKQRNESENSCRREIDVSLYHRERYSIPDPHVPCRAGMVPGESIDVTVECHWRLTVTGRDVSQVIQNEQPAVQ